MRALVAFGCWLACAWLGFGSGAQVRADDAPDPAAVTIHVVSTNDVHGHLAQLPLLGGYVRNLRAQAQRNRGGVLLVDAGDVFQGTLESNLTEGASMIRGYRALGYDALALGNHEFDFGPVGPHMTPWRAGEDPLGALRARIRQAPFPFLCANLGRAAAAGRPLPGLRPSVMLERASLKIGVVGGITEEALSATHAGNTRGLVVTSLPAAITEQARALRKAGARAVIALVHAGGECRAFDDPNDLSSCQNDSEAWRLARALPRGLVDLIVAGHTHAGVAQRVNGIPIIEAYANGRAFGRADLEIPRDRSQPVRVRISPPQRLCRDRLEAPVCAQKRYAGAPVTRDARVLAAIGADLRRAEAARARPLGVEVVSPVERASHTESPLNNLVADLILRAAPGADAAFSNAGALRLSLPVGPLTYGTVFELFPFDNCFATLHVRAADLARILAHNLATSGGILSLAGLHARADCADGRLEVRLSDAQGRAIDPARWLRVVTSDYLATQAHGALAGITLEPGQLRLQHKRLIRDAIVDGLKAYVGAKLHGNDARLFDPQHPRIEYLGRRPVRCAASAAR